MRLEGKLALVTGADSGIGQAIAIAFAREGADVVISYRTDEQGAQNTREQVESEGRTALVVQADVEEPDAIRVMFERVRSELRPVDILVNSAGKGVDSQTSEVSVEDWDSLMNTNVRGPLLCAQEAARDMVAKGSGNIVNISSVSGKKAGGPYSVSKAALDMLTRTLAQELSEKGINVNGISPGLVYTPMTAGNLDEPGKLEEKEEQIPVGRVGDPCDIASLALFLVSDEASYMSGSDVVIDGGSLQKQS